MAGARLRPWLHAAARSRTLLAALCLALLPAAPQAAQSNCAACDLALRDCRAQCTTECRLFDADARQACREDCRGTRDRSWAACATTHASCTGKCAQAADPACPQACLTAMRQQRAQGRTGRKGCVEACRGQARSHRAACRSPEPELRGDCRSRARTAQKACLRSCDAGAAASTDTRSSQVQECMTECAGG